MHCELIDLDRSTRKICEKPRSALAGFGWSGGALTQKSKACKHSLSFLFPRRRNIQHIVAADEAISILGFQLPVHVFLGLFHSNVHIPIQACKDSFIRNAKVISALG